MIKFSQIEYVRPDFKKAKADVKQYMQAFKAAATYEEARELFIEYQKSGDRLSAMRTVASIRNTVDTADKFYEDEMNFFYEETAKFYLIEKEAGELLLSSPFKDDFEREFGSDLIKGIQAMQKLTDESVVPLQVEEAQLCQEYSKITASAKCEFNGEECNFYGLLKYMESTDRSVRKQAYIAWATLYESISERLDAIYSRLCELRVEMATKLGFENYVQMAYLNNGHYYYSAADVAEFRKQVVEVIVPAANALYQKQKKRLGVDELYYYDEQLCFPEGNAIPVGDKDYLLNCAQQMYSELSPETGEFFRFMTEYELFDLETKPNKHMGGYCTFIEGYNAPFIFSNFNGTSADVDVLTHEAGHAFQAYSASKTVKLSSQIWSTNEISEIHSMSMEHFAYPWMEKFFGENADKYRYAHLSEAVKTLPYLCLVDHFQHEVFKKPTSAKERRDIWKKLEKIYLPWRNYEGVDFLEEGGFWMQKQHIFLYPFYYVDYALAQMGAFEFYDRYKKDKQKAWNDYYALCKAGGSKSYFKLLKLANLSNPFKDGAVEKVVKGVLSELESSKY